MNVKTLIDILKTMPPDKEVLIQQGLEYNYATIESIRKATVDDWDEMAYPDSMDDFVVIEFE